MGNSDPIVIPFFRREIVNYDSPVALLGFTNNEVFDGDLYDLKLRNWDINSDWRLNRDYRSIICTRCALFCRNPLSFIQKCYGSLLPGGKLFVDWSFGKVTPFKFRVGWKSNDEHEYMFENSFLWSSIWDDSFLENEQCGIFCSKIKEQGYNNLKDAVYSEVPNVLEYEKVKEFYGLEPKKMYDLEYIKNRQVAYVITPFEYEDKFDPYKESQKLNEYVFDMYEYIPDELKLEESYTYGSVSANYKGLKVDDYIFI